MPVVIGVGYRALMRRLENLEIRGQVETIGLEHN